MTKEELREYLANNLSLEVEEKSPYMGSNGTITIKLKLEDEEISEVYWDSEIAGYN